MISKSVYSISKIINAHQLLFLYNNMLTLTTNLLYHKFAMPFLTGSSAAGTHSFIQSRKSLVLGTELQI